MIKTKSLRFAYNDQRDFHFPDIELENGANLLILGESGVGKTTLLHLIAGLLRPTSGSIELMGTLLQRLSSVKLDLFRGRHIGLVFQQPQFVNALTVQENLALIQYLSNKNQDKKRIIEVLHSLGMDHKLSEKPQHLSRGEQQRIAIAIAVVNRPQLILADEPTSSLDDKNCRKVATMLKDQAFETGAQLIIVTHDQRLKKHFQSTLTI